MSTDRAFPHFRTPTCSDPFSFVGMKHTRQVAFKSSMLQERGDCRM